MQVGKLTSDQLKSIIFSTLNKKRKEVIVRPNIGEDCAILDFGEYVCVMSTDPITGTSEEIGKLAVHITCNDIAASGVEPLGLMLTIMAPVGTKEEEIKKIMLDASNEAAKLNVDIIGGHTEITSAVNRIVLSSTGVGKEKKDKIMQRKSLKPSDILVLTKGAGIEGTGIICFEKYQELKQLYGKEIVEEGKKLLDSISVVKEGIIAGKVGVSCMHDVTEGGVLGAIWEMCELYKLGCTIYKEKIYIHKSTKLVCDHYKIDPLRLISSGSMIIGVSKDKLDLLKSEFEKENIDYFIIGEFTKEKEIILKEGKQQTIVLQPQSDELYKVL
ncbi:Hydrogenase maturation factor [Alkalithermobacter thermoalcaliphilus JW-YL-7 = DSM 7308]|uniref:AIR synthase related protein domain protein n=1 Tax=Alkalithermobacter thermoalcaliphilus JW-YL-7 = DSM 7308 TaxID=1121328 RepID=A0A150FS10_CLOPD|nr:AIR synthase related protein domain protein [[Clostridium] paradoxum JW-YL-7 = DSM 7308]SHK35933.1 Hydrogenase maturation factor [[Clostridium] paradoxum JW-YL-7 = DSM 7308]